MQKLMIRCGEVDSDEDWGLGLLAVLMKGFLRRQCQGQNPQG